MDLKRNGTIKKRIKNVKDMKIQSSQNTNQNVAQPEGKWKLKTREMLTQPTGWLLSNAWYAQYK